MTLYLNVIQLFMDPLISLPYCCDFVIRKMDLLVQVLQCFLSEKEASEIFIVNVFYIFFLFGVSCFLGLFSDGVSYRFFVVRCFCSLLVVSILTLLWVDFFFYDRVEFYVWGVRLGSFAVLFIVVPCFFYVVRLMIRLLYGAVANLIFKKFTGRSLARRKWFSLPILLSTIIFGNIQVLWGAMQTKRTWIYSNFFVEIRRVWSRSELKEFLAESIVNFEEKHGVKLCLTDKEETELLRSGLETGLETMREKSNEVFSEKLANMKVPPTEPENQDFYASMVQWIMDHNVLVGFALGAAFVGLVVLCSVLYIGVMNYRLTPTHLKFMHEGMVELRDRVKILENTVSGGGEPLATMIARDELVRLASANQLICLFLYLSLGNESGILMLLDTIGRGNQAEIAGLCQRYVPEMLEKHDDMRKMILKLEESFHARNYKS